MKKKWNWIDITILLIIILLIVGFLNRDKIIRVGEKVTESNVKDLVITLEAKELTEDMVTDLSVGDKIFSQYNFQNATIKEVVVEPLLRSEAGSDGKMRVYEDSEEVKVTIKIDAQVTYSGPYMELGGQVVKAGNSFVLKTTKVEFPSTIKHIEVK
ncbi:MAG: DUF4330 family protein [Tissierellia bacterium]|nr:DUF4330 family protein [Tissierellia bacterium]